MKRLKTSSERSRPVVIENSSSSSDSDDNDESHDKDLARQLSKQTTTTTPKLVRPIALKVIRPIPAKAAEEFYQQSHATGLSGEWVRAAILESHEWHRKWTHQEETGHTHPHDDHQKRRQHRALLVQQRLDDDDDDHEEDTGNHENKTSPGSMLEEVETHSLEKMSSPSSSSSDRDMYLRKALLPEHYAYNPWDRAMGAKNPSPEDKDALVLYRKRFRLEHESSSEEDGSQACSMEEEGNLSSPHRQQNHHQSHFQREDDSTESGDDEEEDRQDSFLLNRQRPALNIVRPQPVGSNNHLQRPLAQRALTTTTAGSHNHNDNGGGVVHLVKPVALRIARPQPSKMTPTAATTFKYDSSGNHSDQIRRHYQAPPVDIIGSHHDDEGGLSSGNLERLSPLTLPSTSSSYRSKKHQQRNGAASQPFHASDGNNKGPFHARNGTSGGPPRQTTFSSSGQTQEEQLRLQDHCYPHLIEDDANVPHEIVHWPSKAILTQARDDFLHALAVSDVKAPRFQQALELLQEQFSYMGIDTRTREDVRTEGLWLTLTKPTFFGCLGDNDAGDPMYTLGRMSFDMFSPGSLVCSLQGTFNSATRVDASKRKDLMETVPKALKEEVELGQSILRTYDVVTAFTIEPSLAAYPDAPNRDVHHPIRGIMTTYGYTLSDPDEPNRHSVWITGGKIEPNDDTHDQAEWNRIFKKHPPKHSFGEKAKLMTVKLLMGAVIPTEVAQDGSMEYSFTRPIGGHGIAYVDTLYVDDSLRVVRGHRGTIFVFSRMPENSNDNDCNSKLLNGEPDHEHQDRHHHH